MYQSSGYHRIVVLLLTQNAPCTEDSLPTTDSAGKVSRVSDLINVYSGVLPVERVPYNCKNR